MSMRLGSGSSSRDFPIRTPNSSGRITGGVLSKSPKALLARRENSKVANTLSSPAFNYTAAGTAPLLNVIPSRPTPTANAITYPVVQYVGPMPPGGRLGGRMTGRDATRRSTQSLPATPAIRSRTSSAATSGIPDFHSIAADESSFEGVEVPRGRYRLGAWSDSPLGRVNEEEQEEQRAVAKAEGMLRELLEGEESGGSVSSPRENDVESIASTELGSRRGSRSSTTSWNASSFASNEWVTASSSAPTPAPQQQSLQQEQRPKALLATPVPTNVGIMDEMSESIWQFYHEVKQKEETLAKKFILRDLLYDVVKLIFPLCGLYVVGSSLNGFGNDISDMDLCLMTSFDDGISPVDEKRREVATRALEVVKLHLEERPDWVRELHLITAKVPILRVKFHEPFADIQVDLNVNNPMAIRNTHLLGYYSSQDWRVRPLVSVVKAWAKRRDINDANRSSFTSYSLVLMVIHYLQCGVSPPVLPSLQILHPEVFCADSDVRTLNVNETLPLTGWKAEAGSLTLRDLLFGFFNYYSRTFDYDNHAISVRQGQRLLRVEVAKQPPNHETDNTSWWAQWRCICIEEPFTLSNTAHSVYDELVFGGIKKAFLETANDLKPSHDGRLHPFTSVHRFLDNVRPVATYGMVPAVAQLFMRQTQRETGGREREQHHPPSFRPQSHGSSTSTHLGGGVYRGGGAGGGRGSRRSSRGSNGDSITFKPSLPHKRNNF